MTTQTPSEADQQQPSGQRNVDRPARPLVAQDDMIRSAWRKREPREPIHATRNVGVRWPLNDVPVLVEGDGDRHIVRAICVIDVELNLAVLKREVADRNIGVGARHTGTWTSEDGEGADRGELGVGWRPSSQRRDCRGIGDHKRLDTEAVQALVDDAA